MGYYNRFPTLLVPGGFLPQTQTYLAAMSSKPTAPQQTLINTLIKGLIDNSLWDKMDGFYILMLPTEQAALLNAKTPGTLNLAKTGSPSFAANVGFTAGTGAYLATASNLTAFPTYAQDDAHFGVYCENAVTANALTVGSGLNSNEIRVHTAGNSYFAVNDSSPTARTNASGIGHFVVSRASSTTIKGYKNGSQLGADISQNSTAVPSATFKVGGDGTNTGAQCSFAHVGTDLSGADVSTLNTLIEAYRTGVAAL